MKAFALEDFGAEPRVTEIPNRAPGDGEVLVRVQAASLNGFDRAVASGMARAYMEYRFPVVIGRDFAGTLESTGENVFGVLTGSELHHGTIAEFAVVPSAVGLASRPPEVSVADAGALGLAGTTAVTALDAAGVASGQTVLIAGATGGVGSFAVQLAKARGARVVATAHSDDADYVRDLGADDVIDYDGEPSGKVDVVLHFAGDGARLVSFVRDGGTLVSAVGFGQDAAGDTNVTVHTVSAVPKHEILTSLAAAVADGSLRVPIDRAFSLADAPEALQHFAAHKRGKIAIDVS
jgi:NADPH:quinone reductase-like Zn-dependent oxidoreductase